MASSQQQQLPIASPRPRRPNGGILVRSPSTDCVAKRCVKWAQCQPQIFEVEAWDRSPCPVTPKLTYRDLVELKQLELDKVPQSPFKSLADLPMPIGLPRVRVGLQPFFDRPTTTPPGLNSNSSESSSMTPLTSTSTLTTSSSSSSSSSSCIGGILHPPTPNTTPVPTPPRTESPQPGGSGTIIQTSSNTASSGGVNVCGPLNRNDPMMRKSFAASSAANLAKVPSTSLHPSPPSSPPPNTSSFPFPSSSLPPTSSSSPPYVSFGDSTGSGPGPGTNYAVPINPAACTHPSPLSTSEPISEANIPLPSSPTTSMAIAMTEATSRSLAPSSTIIADTTEADEVPSPSTVTSTTTPTNITNTESHPALVLTSALLAQRTPSPLNDSEFPHPLRSKAPSGSNSSFHPPQQRKLKIGFQFMPLLPPSPSSPTENTDDTTSTSLPSSQSQTSPAEDPQEELHTSSSDKDPSDVASSEHEDDTDEDVDVDADDDEEEDDVSRAFMSPADLIAIGGGGVGIGLDSFTNVSCPLVAAATTRRKPAAPPSEADTDTESTLHSDFDHFDHDHTTDVDQMTEGGNTSSCGCCSSSVSSHEPGDRDVDADEEPESGEPGEEDGEPEELGEEDEEPEEPDEPDLSPEDIMRLLMEDVGALPAYSATTESSSDSERANTDSGSPADSTSPDNNNNNNIPAPGTFTKIKEIVSTAVMDDEDVHVRVSAARCPPPGVRDSSSAIVVSPLAVKVASNRNSSPHSRTTPPSSPRSSPSSSSANNAWSHILW